MAILKCVCCETVFSRVAAEELCPQCEQEAAHFRGKVDAYHAYYPAHDAAAVAAATGVPRVFVEAYLSGAPAPAAMRAEAEARPACLRCGAASVEVGPHCRHCALELRQEVHEVAQEAQEEAEAPKKHVSLAADRREESGESFRALRYRYDQ